MKKLILVEMTIDELETLIIDCVSVCLKHHKPHLMPNQVIESGTKKPLSKKQKTENPKNNNP